MSKADEGVRYLAYLPNDVSVLVTVFPARAEMSFRNGRFGNWEPPIFLHELDDDGQQI